MDIVSNYKFVLKNVNNLDMKNLKEWERILEKLIESQILIICY